MRLASSISLFCCILVMIVYSFSKKIRLKSYNKIIFYIALCDSLSSLGGLLGISKNGTFQCSIQTILTNIFPLAGIFWTTVISCILFTIIHKINVGNHEITFEWWVHLICWGIPTLVTLLPLSTEDYGTHDGEDGWCFLRPRDDSPPWTYNFWVFAAFFGWVYLALMIYIALILYISLVMPRISTGQSTKAMIRRVLHKLIWYPIIILVSWSLITVYDIWVAFEPNDPALNDPIFIDLTFSLPLFSGFLTSLAFFLGSAEARGTLNVILLSVRNIPVTTCVSLITESSNDEERRIVDGDLSNERTLDQRSGSGVSRETELTVDSY